jgi:hypothetical protein
MIVIHDDITAQEVDSLEPQLLQVFCTPRHPFNENQYISLSRFLYRLPRTLISG